MIYPVSQRGGAESSQGSLKSGDDARVHSAWTTIQAVSTGYTEDIPLSKRKTGVHVATEALRQDASPEYIQLLIKAIEDLKISGGDESFKSMCRDVKESLEKALNTGSWNVVELLKLFDPLLEKLVRDLTKPSNINVIKILADAGCKLQGSQNLGYKLGVPLPLLTQLLNNTDKADAKAIIYNHFDLLFFLQDPLSNELLKTYCSEQEITQMVRDLFNRKFKCICVNALPYSVLPLQTIHWVLPPLMQRIQDSMADKAASPKNDQSLSVCTDLLADEDFLGYVSLLEVCVRNGDEFVGQSLNNLPEPQRKILLMVSLVLGQSRLFNQLKPYIDLDNLVTPVCHGDNLLHILADGLLSGQQENLYSLQCLCFFQSDYKSIWQHLPVQLMANQQDGLGRLPLDRFYRHNSRVLGFWSVFDEDEYLIQGRRDLLLTHTSRENLARCMTAFLQSDNPKNINWFRDFLTLHIQSGGQWDKSVALNTKLAIDDDDYRGRLSRNAPIFEQAIQRVVDLFRKEDGILSCPEKVIRLLDFIEECGLPVKYRAMVLSMLPISQQQHVLSELITEERQKAIFIEQKYQVKYRGHHFYPWHLIALGLHGNIVPRYTCEDASRLSVSLLAQVSHHQQLHPKESAAALPPGLVHQLQETCTAGQTVIYGRSLAIPFTGVKGGYLRFKFLKKQYEKIEKWEDFIREQVHLDFFREHKNVLGLESALLKPKGIYRLENADEQLRAWGLPESFLASLALEQDGSACLQVFEDEPATCLYHYYPYDVSGGEGLSRQASFNGIRMFARDAGRLWRREIQAPDTLSTFHSESDGRGWVPTPFFGGSGVAGTLGEWNAQNYPNISPAPVGMRDWADVRAFNEHEFTTFGMGYMGFMLRDANQPERYGQLRISELGRVFYGLVINWLRVRHDIHELDYCNEDHIRSLEYELVIIASDLFGPAYGLTGKMMNEAINSFFPKEARRRAAIEAAYWCDPDSKYVEDIRENRFPDEVYPDHPTRDLNKSEVEYCHKYLSDKGITPFSCMKGVNLGVNSGTFPLIHLDSLYWCSLLQGWLANS